MASAAAMSTRMATTVISGESVFAPRFMASIANIASPITRFVSLEVVEALRSSLGQWSGVTVMRIKPVIDMSVKSAMPVKPRTCSKKNSAYKPIRSVVAVRSAVIGRIVEVSVGAHRSRTDIYANGNLGWRHGCRA